MPEQSSAYNMQRQELMDEAWAYLYSGVDFIETDDYTLFTGHIRFLRTVSHHLTKSYIFPMRAMASVLLPDPLEEHIISFREKYNPDPLLLKIPFWTLFFIAVVIWAVIQALIKLVCAIGVIIAGASYLGLQASAYVIGSVLALVTRGVGILCRALGYPQLSPDHAIDKYFATAHDLHMAIEKDDLDLAARILLDNPFVNHTLNTTDQDKFYVLAFQAQRQDIIDKFLMKFPDFDSLRPVASERTPLLSLTPPMSIDESAVSAPPTTTFTLWESIVDSWLPNQVHAQKLERIDQHAVWKNQAAISKLPADFNHKNKIHTYIENQGWIDIFTQEIINRPVKLPTSNSYRDVSSLNQYPWDASLTPSPRIYTRVVDTEVAKAIDTFLSNQLHELDAALLAAHAESSPVNGLSLV